MEEGLTTLHQLELLEDTLDDFLDGSGVTDEVRCHLQTTWRDIAQTDHDVTWDPLNEIRLVLLTDVQDLLFNVLSRNTATEQSHAGQVQTVAWVAGCHHVLVVEHLAGEFGDGQGAVHLAAAGSERCETVQHDLHTHERHQVGGNLTKVGIELTREPEGAGLARENERDEVVQVTIGWASKLQGTEADIVQGLVIDGEEDISAIEECVDGKACVVRLDDHIGHEWRWDDGEGALHLLIELFVNLGQDEGTKTGTGTTTEGVAKLEALHAVACLSLLTNHIHDGIDQVKTVRQVSTGIVVTGTGLAEHEVLRAEQLAEGAGADAVHRTRLKINQDCTGDVTATSCLVVVHVDVLDLQLRVAAVLTVRVDTVLVRDYFPELRADLVTTLACLNVN